MSSPVGQTTLGRLRALELLIAVSPPARDIPPAGNGWHGIGCTWIFTLTCIYTAFILQQSWEKPQDLFFHGLISHNDKAVPDFHRNTFHCSYMGAFQSLLAHSPASFTALFRLILHFILLSSNFLICQGEHLSSLHHKETQRHLSTRGCVSQMPATFNSQKAAYLQTVYSVWGNTLHKEPF